MANLARQKEKLLSLFDRALEASRELESGKGAGAGLRDLYRGWLKDGLTKAKQEVNMIDTSKVDALRKAKQTTEPVFESHIDQADTFLKSTKGVKYAIKELFKEKQDYSADEIRKLHRVSKLTDQTLRRMAILRSRALSLITSGGLWICILAVALMTIPVYRYGAIYLQSRKSVAEGTPRGAVAEQAQRDINVIQAKATEPNKSVLERSASVAKDVWTLVDTIPKIITALSAAWGLMIIWFRRYKPQR